MTETEQLFLDLVEEHVLPVIEHYSVIVEKCPTSLKSLKAKIISDVKDRIEKHGL